MDSKKLRSLTLAFALALGSSMGLAGRTAAAQDMGIPANFVSEEAVNEIVAAGRVEEGFAHVGVAFTRAHTRTKEYAAVRFRLSEGQWKVAEVYNLNDPLGRSQYDEDYNNARADEKMITSNGTTSGNRSGYSFVWSVRSGSSYNYGSRR